MTKSESPANWWQRLTHRQLLGWWAFAIGIALLGLTAWSWKHSQQIVSPLTNSTTFQFLAGQILSARSGTDKVVYGFVPYWNLDDVTIQPELTHFSYFGLPITGAGTISTSTDQNPDAIGYTKLQSEDFLNQLDQVIANNDKLEIVLIQFNNDDIVTLATNQKSQDELLKTIDSLILAYPVSGINIDIEYTGPVTPELRRDFAAMVEKVSNHVHTKYNGVQVSIDMYASASTRNLIWDVEEIGKHVDYIIVMAYDFHQRSSTVAGPVAPLFGGKELWDSDINQQLKAFVDQVPPNKILLGIPFYGYEWQTTTVNPQAHTFPNTGSTASYKRVNQLLSQADQKQVSQHWNDQALSPYLTYTEDDKLYVLYYENSRSLSYKLDFVNQLDLGGIAIWALGYEGSDRELWEVIERKL